MPPTALVKKLLPVLDTADLALAHGGARTSSRSTAALFDVLSREGLERIDRRRGSPSTREVHDAVAHEPAEGEGAPELARRSVEVLRAGYRWKGRVLRPADGESQGLSDVAAQREWLEKDYYKVLGVPKTASDKESPRLPQTGQAVPP